MFDLDSLREPIVQAPMAGGPSTPALAAAVCDAGGLGFLAAGYRSAEVLATDVEWLRGQTERPFGVNVFVPPAEPAEPAAVAAYVRELQSERAELGEPRFDDDDWRAKLDVIAATRVDVASFTFGCPGQDVVERLHAAGVAVWVTITTAAEARVAAAGGADALVVQGVEAGGHRASFRDDGRGDLGLLALLRTVAAVTTLPLVATGAIADGAAVAAVLCAGAAAAQVGTALMLTPEAATSDAHRAALTASAPRHTRLTRAFSGRLARGIENRFMAEHGEAAPSAYPEIHHVTAPLRAAARAAGDAESINLWAGQAHPLARELPAAEIVRTMGAQAREVLAVVGARWCGAGAGAGASAGAGRTGGA